MNLPTGNSASSARYASFHLPDVSSLDLGSERACPRFFVTGLPLGMHVVTCQKQDEVLRLCQARLPRVLRQADFIVTFAEPAQIDVAGDLDELLDFVAVEPVAFHVGYVEHFG